MFQRALLPSLAPRRAAAPPRRAAPEASARLRCACGGGCPRCQGSRPGHALPVDLRTTMESRLGAPLADVRVHAGQAAADAARAQRARAFTVGDDVFFDSGRYAPGSAEGRRLIAHELVHVVQQRGGRPRGTAASAEAEARSLGPRVAGGQAVRVSQSAAPGVQRDGPDEDPDQGARQAFNLSFARALNGGVAPLGDPGQFQLPPLWYRPSLMGLERTDVGGAFTPYYDRGIMPNTFGDTRDVGPIFDILQSRLALTQQLPDWLGPPAKLIFGDNWRGGIAVKLTAATVDAGLKNQALTVFELSDMELEARTGAKTHRLPFSIPVPGLNDLWNKFSGGGK